MSERRATRLHEIARRFERARRERIRAERQKNRLLDALRIEKHKEYKDRNARRSHQYIKGYAEILNALGLGWLDNKNVTRTTEEFEAMHALVMAILFGDGLTASQKESVALVREMLLQKPENHQGIGKPAS